MLLRIFVESDGPTRNTFDVTLDPPAIAHAAVSIEKYAIVAWCSSVNAGSPVSKMVAYNSLIPEKFVIIVTFGGDRDHRTSPSLRSINSLETAGWMKELLFELSV